MASFTSTQLQLDKPGGSLQLVQVPVPKLGPDEVLLRSKVLALNLLDVKQRDHGVLVQSWPFVLGYENSGVVEAVGSNVTDLAVGDEALAFQSQAFQERNVVQRTQITKKPSNISLEEAASLPSCYITAVSGIIRTLSIPLSFLDSAYSPSKNQVPVSVLVLGGSSATGAAVIQLLREAYPELPILATASPKHYARVQSLGANHVVDYRSTTVVADLVAASPGEGGVDVIIDAVSAGATQTDIFDVFSSSGSKRYASVLTGITVEVPKGINYLEISAFFLPEQIVGVLMKELVPLVEKGIYKVPLPVRVLGHGLKQVSDVLDEIKTVSGEKLLVTL